MHKRNSTLTAERVREAFSYSKTTGILTWRISRRGHTRVGDPVGVVSNGYVIVGLDGHKVFAHRVIWLYVTGSWPTNDIDHKNRKPADNRWRNLRDVTASVNLHNVGLRKQNTSGCSGVDWCKRERLWRARINVNKVAHNLGYYVKKSDAILARKTAEKDLRTKCLN